MEIGGGLFFSRGYNLDVGVRPTSRPTAFDVLMVAGGGAGGPFIGAGGGAGGVLAGSLAAIEISKSDEGRQLRTRHQLYSNKVKFELKKYGLPVMNESVSHIVPVLVGNNLKAAQICNTLMNDYNIYIQSINYPTVERGTITYYTKSTSYAWNDWLSNSFFSWCLGQEWSWIEATAMIFFTRFLKKILICLVFEILVWKTHLARK